MFQGHFGNEQWKTAPGPSSNFIDDEVEVFPVDVSSALAVRSIGFAGISDTNVGTFSMWYKFLGGDGSHRIPFLLSSGGSKFQLWCSNTNRWTLFTVNAAGTQSIYDQLSTAAAGTADGNWHHVLWSWNTSTGAIPIYVDDVGPLATSVFAASPGVGVDYTGSMQFWAQNAGGGNKFNACYAQMYVNTDEFVDITVEANRRKFVSAAVKPVNLGADGSVPTGNQPSMFFNSPAASWLVNSGYGGDLTAQTSAPTDCPDSPLD